MEQTVILNFEVDQSKAVKDLERTESALLDLKKEQADLNKQYKAGEISQAQYVRENIKLQNSLKKENEQKRVLQKSLEAEKGSRNAIRNEISRLTKEYDKLNLETKEGIQQADKLEKELAQLNAQLTKGDKAAGLFKNQIGNYPKQFQDAASSINIAGTSVGGITSKLAMFANPATAAIGVVTALGAAYARSTIGAKDLSFAQNQLSIATGLVTNSLADLVSSSEDGEGAVTRLLNTVLTFFDEAPTFIIPRTILEQLGIDIGEIQKKSKELALIQEELDDLQRDEIAVRGKISERLAENQELLTEINDEQTELNKKIELSEKIENNLRVNQSELLTVLAQQLSIITQQSDANKSDEDLLTKKNELAAEFNKITADTEKKIQANQRAQNKLIEQLREQQRLEAGANRRAASGGIENAVVGVGESPLPLETPTSSAEAAVEGQQKLANDLLKINKKYYEDDAAFKRQGAAIKEQIDKDTAAASARILGEASELFDESTAAYKVTATGQTLISTYLSAQRAFESLVGLPVVGPGLAAAAAAIAVAQGLQRVAAINGIGFAEGGYTGPGRKNDPKGVVHAGEVVWSQEDVSRVGGPLVADAMRPTHRLKGYADGGFVTNTNISSAQQALITANALKNMPPPVVSWTEGRTVGRRVEFRESVSRL